MSSGVRELLTFLCKWFIFGTLLNGDKGFGLLLRPWSQMSRSNGYM